jgi:hypothetical protein
MGVAAAPLLPAAVASLLAEAQAMANRSGVKTTEMWFLFLTACGLFWATCQGMIHDLPSGFGSLIVAALPVYFAAMRKEHKADTLGVALDAAEAIIPKADNVSDFEKAGLSYLVGHQGEIAALIENSRGGAEAQRKA